MSDDIYSPPVAKPLPSAPIDRKRGRGIAIARVVLLAATLVGLIGTVVGMVGALGTLAESGQADPSKLAGDIQIAMVTTLIGSGVALVGAVLCGIALFGQGNRGKWFLRCGMTLSILNLLVVPVGTVIGIVLIIGFIVKWNEFQISTHP
jgi:ABC-type Fe3+ transport system permease subunit